MTIEKRQVVCRQDEEAICVVRRGRVEPGRSLLREMRRKMASKGCEPVEIDPEAGQQPSLGRIDRSCSVVAEAGVDEMCRRLGKYAVGCDEGRRVEQTIEQAFASRILGERSDQRAKLWHRNGELTLDFVESGNFFESCPVQICGADRRNH